VNAPAAVAASAAALRVSRDSVVLDDGRASVDRNANPRYRLISRNYVARMVGDAELMNIPPPDPKPGVLKLLWPLRIVKPLKVELVVSPVVNVTTEPLALPSMIVTDGPPELVTVMALPMKLIFSV